jgi:nicotinamide-nucleotide amidase
MIRAEVVTIGNELLIGRQVDTNSSFMCAELAEIGISVVRKISVGDDVQEIYEAIDVGANKVNLKIFSGGLGPTHDDKTKEAVCRYFDSELIIDQEVLSHIEQLFARRNVTISQINQDQALVPHNASVFMNDKGTAPGLVLEKDETVFIFLPAVPYELKFLMQYRVKPYLRQKFPEMLPVRICDFLFSGIGESALFELLESQTQLFNGQHEFAFLPSPGLIRFRQTICGENEDTSEKVFNVTEKILTVTAGKYFYGRNAESVAHILQRIFTEKGLTFSVAESCTGGHIAHMITSVSGSSAWFKGGIVAYDNQVKISMLHVNENVLMQSGAVSEEVVRQMAMQCRNEFNTDYAAAVSGIAGPDGGSPEKPVGTVWIALATPDSVKTKLFHFGPSDRSANIQRASNAALMMILDEFKQ